MGSDRHRAGDDDRQDHLGTERVAGGHRGWANAAGCQPSASADRIARTRPAGPAVRSGRCAAASPGRAGASRRRSARECRPPGARRGHAAGRRSSRAGPGRERRRVHQLYSRWARRHNAGYRAQGPRSSVVAAGPYEVIRGHLARVATGCLEHGIEVRKPTADRHSSLPANSETAGRRRPPNRSSGSYDQFGVSSRWSPANRDLVTGYPLD